MQIVYFRPGASSPEVFEPRTDLVHIGRAPTNDVVLNSPFVAAEAAALERRNGNWELVVLQLANVKVGDRKLSLGDRVPIEVTQTINIFPVDLVIKIEHVEQDSDQRRRARLDTDVADLIREIHRQLLDERELRSCLDRVREDLANERPVRDDDLLQLEQAIDELSRRHGNIDSERRELVNFIAGRCVHSELLRVISDQAGVRQPASWFTSQHWSQMASRIPARERELDATVQTLLEDSSTGNASDIGQQLDAVQNSFWSRWDCQAREMLSETKNYLAQRFLKKEIKDILCGLGPLEDLLRMPTISEIMVVDRDHIFVERAGRLENSGRRFVSDLITVEVIKRIVRKVNRTIDASRPLVDARLPDGSRVNAVIAPLAVSGPCLTIRRFPLKRLRIEDLVERGTLSADVADFLMAAVICKKNIIISGGTGSGKTTLLNAMADSIPDRERIITIEDTAELQIPREHRVRLEARKANAEGEGEYTIGDLVRNALRMRPDRIIVGECRGADAMDMLQAMNTGHSGSMTTIHANTTRDVIQRLEVLVQMADVKLPLASIHRQIASAVELIVQLSRMRDGSRRITQVTEVVGLDDQTGELRLRDLFLLRDGAEGAALRATGHLPSFMSELIDRGLLKLETFYVESPRTVTK